MANTPNNLADDKYSCDVCNDDADVQGLIEDLFNDPRKSDHFLKDVMEVEQLSGSMN